MDPEIIIPFVVFFTIGLTLYTWITRTQQTKQKQLATLQSLAESNSEISPAVIEALMPTNRTESDFRRGVLLVAIGLMLCIVLFVSEADSSVALLGLIPAVIGGIYLAFAKRAAK